MAQEKIIIKFEPKGHKPLIAALNQLADAQRRATGESKKQAKAGGILDTGHKRLAKTNGILANSFATIRSKMLLVSFAMSMGVKQLIGFIKQSAKIEEMSRAFNSLSGGVDSAVNSMQKLQSATNGAMSQFDLLQQANNALILGVSRNSNEMAEMFDIAQRLGRALGRDTKSSVESLITGIGRQSRLMLDNIGIIVKAESAYQAFAEMIGVNADQLTETQRKQAFLNATMEAARIKVSQLNEELPSTQSSLEKVTAAWEDSNVAMGNFAITLFSLDKNLPHFARSLRSITKVIEGQKLTLIDHNQIWLNFIDNAHLLTPILGIWGFQLDNIAEKFGKGAESTQNLLATLLMFEAMPSPLAKWVEDGESFEDRPFPLLYDEEDIENMSEGAKQVQRILAEMNAATKKNIDIDKIHMVKKIKIWADGISTIGNILDLNSKNSKHVANIQALASVVDAFAMAQTASMQAAKNPMTIPFPAYPSTIYGITLAKGLAQAAATKAAADKMEQGGLIGGRRHSQGGTMIEAEQGEFIMSRSAVESIGIENLNRMNQGGGGAVTVNVSGNVLSQDFVEGELAENIKEAVRRGTDFGIS
tara:strand:+ start:2064 stop:3833 length:1770 start_codon:yes stop_codon:yes gene_type:complete